MSLNKNNDSQNNNNNNKKKAIIQFVALAIMCGISLFLFYDAFLSPGALEEAPYVEFVEAVENDEVFVIEYDRDCTFFYWYTELDPAELEEKTVPENLKFNFAELLASAQEDEETKSEETEEVPQETIKIGNTERPVPEFVERHKSANPTYSEFKKDMLEIDADGHVLKLRIEDMYESFHLGLDACEGINRFYDFVIEKASRLF